MNNAPDRRITLMLRKGDDARVDIAMTPERSYYRLASDDSIEDRELAPLDDFAHIAATIVQDYPAREGERPLDADTRFQLFINNRLIKESPSSESLKRCIDILTPLYPEFTTLRKFGD